MNCLLSQRFLVLGAVLTMAAITGLTPDARADVYMWRDARGVIHFSDRKKNDNYQRKAPGRLEAAPEPQKAAQQTGTTVRSRIAKNDIDHDQLNRWIAKYSNEFGVDPDLVRAVIHAESDYNHLAVSRAGAMGLMQLMPGTAGDVGVNDAFDPEHNVRGGTKYLAMMLDQFQNNVKLAVAAYNAGPHNVTKYRGIPPFEETRTYVKRVMMLHEAYRQQRLWASVLRPETEQSSLTSPASFDP